MGVGVEVLVGVELGVVVVVDVGVRLAVTVTVAVLEAVSVASTVGGESQADRRAMVTARISMAMVREGETFVRAMFIAFWTSRNLSLLPDIIPGCSD